MVGLMTALRAGGPFKAGHPASLSLSVCVCVCDWSSSSSSSLCLCSTNYSSSGRRLTRPTAVLSQWLRQHATPRPRPSSTSTSLHVACVSTSNTDMIMIGYRSSSQPAVTSSMCDVIACIYVILLVCTPTTAPSK